MTWVRQGLVQLRGTAADEHSLISSRTVANGQRILLFSKWSFNLWNSRSSDFSQCIYLRRFSKCIKKDLFPFVKTDGLVSIYTFVVILTFCWWFGETSVAIAPLSCAIIAIYLHQRHHEVLMKFGFIGHTFFRVKLRCLASRAVGLKSHLI